MSKLAPFALLSLFFVSNTASAAVFNPATSADLQTALTTAAGSTEDDVINLQATTYLTSDNGNATFTYSSTNNGSLTITGAGAGSSILDGNLTRQVIQLVSTGAAASFQLSDLTIRNGRTGGISGLEVQGVDGDQSLTDCEILNNIDAGGDGSGIGGVALQANGTGDQTISNCLIQNNSGGNIGGAQLFTTGNIQFTDNVVSGNEISGISSFGLFGGVAMTSQGTTTSVVARGNEIRNNIADSVNGIRLTSFNGASLTLEENVIADNQSTTAFSGGAQLQTGNGSPEIVVRSNVVTGNSASFANGIQVQNGANGNIVFENNVIQNNRNDIAFGGGVQLQNNESGNITVRGNNISNNTGSFATGIQVQNNENGSLTFEGNIISENINEESTHGGAQLQHNGNGALRIVDNLLFGNVAKLEGGGLFIVSSAETLTLINNTVVQNSLVDPASEGGGIFLVVADETGTTNIYNNILFGNSSIPADSGSDLSVVSDAFTGIQLFNNDFGQACFGDTPVCDPAAVTGLTQGANINADPLFVNPEAGNFQLGPDSPAINTGDSSAPGLPELDLAGNPRVFDGQVDMGAFETQPLLTADPTSLDFGFVGIGEEESQVLTLRNAGTSAVSVDGFQLSDSANYELDLNAGDQPCGSSSFDLATGESCSLAVVFGPGAEGTLNANLKIDTGTAIPTVVELIGSGQGENGGGCSLGVAALGRGFMLAILIPISAVALSLRRRR